MAKFLFSFPKINLIKIIGRTNIVNFYSYIIIKYEDENAYYKYLWAVSKKHGNDFPKHGCFSCARTWI